MLARTNRRDRQMVRILGLLSVLLEGGRPSVHELANRFGTRRETIYRDLRALSDAGYPIVGDENGRLSHPRLLDRDGRAIPQIQFTQDEIAALIWAAKNHDSGQPFGKALASGCSKLRGIAATKKQSLASELDQVVLGRGHGKKDYSRHHTVIIRLVEAIIRRLTCQITYQSPGSEPKTYPYHPYRLLMVQGGMYCLGRVPAYSSFTTLAVERIRELRLTDEPFVIDATFDAERYSNEAFGVTWEEPMTVVLRFRSDQALYVAEREWHPSQTLKTLRDGRVELTFHAGGTYEIIRWILGWGDAVEVLRPARLRREVAEILQNAAESYLATRKADPPIPS